MELFRRKTEQDKSQFLARAYAPPSSHHFPFSGRRQAKGCAQAARKIQ